MKIACTYFLILAVFCGCSNFGNKTVNLTFIVDIDHPYYKRWNYKHDILDNARAVIEKRLHSYDIDQPKVQLSNKNDARISIEVATKYTAEELAGLLVQPGFLQIVETYGNEDFFPILQRANDTLAKTLRRAIKPVAANTGPRENFDSTSLKGYLKNSKTNSDGSFVSEHPLFEVLTPFCNADNSLISTPVVGRIFIRDTAKLGAYLKTDAVKAILPADVRFLFQAEKGDSVLMVYALKQPNARIAPFDGRYISGAKQGTNKISKKPTITVEMNEAGIRKWTALTGNNINHFLAIIFDGDVLAAPRVLQEITGNYTEISCPFSVEQTKALVAQVNSGNLPAPMKLAP